MAIAGEINKPVKMVADKAGDWLQAKGKNVNLRVETDGSSASFTPSENGKYVFHCGSQTFEVQVGVSEPPIPPVVEPPTPTGDVLYDSLTDSKLHDGNVRSLDTEGLIAPNGKGVECRASGNPRIQVNEDGTFSLIVDAGHGRFYGFVINYNATMIIECAFWNQVSGQDLSLKMRSRHNEGGVETNRFGGYGLSIDRSGWGSKVEQFHNEHSESSSGSLPAKPETGKYFKVEFTVKDSGSGVELIGKYNGTQFMKKTVKKYNDEALFMKQSYFWVRSNIDSGTGEIRIKRLRIVKA
jgi:hypothetical protein